MVYAASTMPRAIRWGVNIGPLMAKLPPHQIVGSQQLPPRPLHAKRRQVAQLYCLHTCMNDPPWINHRPENANRVGPTCARVMDIYVCIDAVCVHGAYVRPLVHECEWMCTSHGDVLCPCTCMSCVLQHVKRQYATCAHALTQHVAHARAQVYTHVAAVHVRASALSASDERGTPASKHGTNTSHTRFQI